MPVKVEAGPKLSPDAAAIALSRLSAYAYARHPSKVSARLAALQDAHAAVTPPVPALVALEEALALLGALGARERAVEWCDQHHGMLGFWPCLESMELRERGRAMMRGAPSRG